MRRPLSLPCKANIWADKRIINVYARIFGASASTSREKRLNAPCNCYALRRATRHVTQLYDHVLSPVGRRITQYSLLAELERRGRMTLVRLAETMVLDRATLGHNVRPLLALGYLTLSVGEDRRSREAMLTQTGREVLAEAKPLWQRAQAVFEDRIGAGEAAALRTALNCVAGTGFSYA